MIIFIIVSQVFLLQELDILIKAWGFYGCVELVERIHKNLILMREITYFDERLVNSHKELVHLNILSFQAHQ